MMKLGDQSHCRQAGGRSLARCVQANAELIQWPRVMEMGEVESHLEFSKLLGMTSRKVFTKTLRPSSSYFLPGMEMQWLLKLLVSCTLNRVWEESCIPNMEEHGVKRSPGPWQCTEPLCTCQRPSFSNDRENNLICSSHYSQACVTGSQMQFLNAFRITAQKHLVICFLFLWRNRTIQALLAKGELGNQKRVNFNYQSLSQGNYEAYHLGLESFCLFWMLC